MPKVSIIIPVYNVERYLRECLDSAISQTLEDIEIICLNDCSTDKSWDILFEYALLDDRIKIVDSDKNRGVGYARNYALGLVNSDYIMYLDSDDWLEPDACEKAYNQISQNNNDFVFFGIAINDEIKGTRYYSKQRFDILRDYIGKSHLKFSKMDKPYMSNIAAWCRIFKTSYLRENNLLFDEKHYYEDIPFFFNLILTDPDFSILEEYIYNYRKRNGSITHSFPKYKDELLMWKKFYGVFRKYNSEKYTTSYISNCIRILWGHYKFFAKNNLLFELMFYNKIRNFFRRINKENNVEKVKDEINYKEFKKIIKYGYAIRLCLQIIKNIFSIRNTSDKRHKTLTLLGFRMNFKRTEFA